MTIDNQLDRRVDAFTSIERQVRAAGGLTPMHLWELRNAYGKARLGSGVLVGIKSWLKSHGLLTLPSRLTLDQNQHVYVYVEESWIGRVIDAVLRPAPDTEDADLFRELIGGKESDKILDEIRELLAK